MRCGSTPPSPPSPPSLTPPGSRNSPDPERQVGKNCALRSYLRRAGGLRSRLGSSARLSASFLNLAPAIGSPHGLLSPFKHRKSFVSRKNEVAAIRIRFPYKLPVIVERYSKEKLLPALNKVKFLVPGDFTMGQFVAIIRNRMGLMSTQAFYFLVNGNHSLVNMSATMGDVYTTYKDEDGFLYMTYASQEMFG